ncbi:DEAD/DEAH box helicase [Pseudoxanthomonas winnipegensis]|uniref:DEAD/DEAH box helicase n=1 Tax=Pseudoxanthomonas winnipegensis TaxID=2480810 RepID=A0A4Q8L9V3_9GAMM|nr:DEAD/DEAH box helicase [Pseudoxanthomonas winnipegensis]RZZ81422.1 DEAD/DEAH box helicase [Pseudoxanthomonas winnipegensis]TAA25417.1 DEAD/DEAH box helicase [Pseudoxanthomonas winnipegensis]
MAALTIDLRDYQEAAFDRAREAIRAGARKILIVAPTGSGKTVLASALMQMAKEKGNRASFVVDRLSLIQQTSETFDRYGLDHGVIQGGHVRWSPWRPLQLCSVQTLARRNWPESKLDVFDEAHVLHTTHKRRIGEADSIVVGLTATPFTRGLGKWFDAVINVTTTRKLINDGWLAPYRIYSCVEPDMAKVKVKSTGEWDEKEASKKALEVVGDVVAEYLKHGEGRKFICSGVDTAHVEAMHRQFTAAGITVATYTYRDSEEDRGDVTAEFRKPNSAIRGLITVTAASRGFDVPDVSCIIMARPLRKSLAEHIQLLGRGLRIAPGKTDCLVLDHSGNSARFFQDCEDFFDNGLEALDDGKPKRKQKAKPKKEREPVKCPECSALHLPSPKCPSCGHDYPRRAGVEHVPGTLKELIAGNHRAELSKSVWPMVCHYARSRRQDLTAARKLALALYRDMTGDWPAVSFDTTTPIQPIPEVASKIRSLQIRHGQAMKARQAGVAS